MMLNDRQIRDRCIHSPVLLNPFSEAVSGGGVMSYGLSHAGYDLRLGPEILVFKNTICAEVDPKLFNDPAYQDTVFEKLLYPDPRPHPEHLHLFLTEQAPSMEDAKRIMLPGNRVRIPAGGYILGRSYEYIQMPKDLKGRCVGKSTYARCGIIVNTTPLEPGWEGHLTIEIGNITPCPAVVYVMEGIAQLEFEDIEPPEKDYRGKKYQHQTGVVPARVL